MKEKKATTKKVNAEVVNAKAEKIATVSKPEVVANVEKKAVNVVEKVTEVKKTVEKAEPAKIVDTTTANQTTENKVEKVADKKVADKKVADKKATEKKADKVADKKVVEKKAEKKTAKKEEKKVEKKADKKTANKSMKDIDTKVLFQIYGSEIEPAELLEKAKADFIAAGGAEKSIKKIELYIKPEDNAAYYVVNGAADGINKGKVVIFE